LALHLSLGVKSPRERDDQAAAAEINQGDEGSALWKPKARWLIRRILELRPSSRPLDRLSRANKDPQW
jgi:hypothetical protein